jgi:hypothetical protein
MLATLPAGSTGICSSASVGIGAFDRPHAADRLELRTRLPAGADDRRDRRVGPRERAGREAAGRAGADLSQRIGLDQREHLRIVAEQGDPEAGAGRPRDGVALVRDASVERAAHQVHRHAAAAHALPRGDRRGSIGQRAARAVEQVDRGGDVERCGDVGFADIADHERPSKRAIEPESSAP